MRCYSKNKYLYQVPKEYRTYKLCQQYLAKDIMNIIYIPEDVRSKIITKGKAKAILKYSFELIDFLPPQILNKKFMTEILKERALYDFKVASFLKYMPKTALTTEICHECVIIEPESIRLLPERMVTKKLWNIALLRNNKLIKQVPTSYLTHSIIQTLLSANGMLIKHIPDVFNTKQAKRIAIRNNPGAFRYAY